MRMTSLFVLLAVGVSGSRAVAGDPSELGAYIIYVESGWNSHEEDARADALEHVRAHLMVHLQAQKPPIRSIPSIERIEREFATKELPTRSEWFPSPINDKMFKVDLRGEITPEQIRELRSIDRMWWLARMGGIGLTLMVVLVLFFRLDDWAKGRITHWLGLGAAAILMTTALVLTLI